MVDLLSLYRTMVRIRAFEDAAEVARLLGIRCDTISIEPAMTAFGAMLAESSAGCP